MIRWLLLFTAFLAASAAARTAGTKAADIAIAAEIRADTLRTWEAYRRDAWGHDELRPLSHSGHDWYAGSLHIAPIDGYSTLKLMGFTAQTREIERYVVNDVRFDTDQFVKTYEVYQRILGGLLVMYADTHDPRILAKAQTFADRVLPAFASPTGMPYYYVNLKTGATKGTRVNVAEAASYVFEFGILSYYTHDPRYYQAGMKAERAVFSRRSAVGLVGQDIDVETGQWLTRQSHVGAYIDSYYEYMWKAWLLLGDPELKAMWDASLPPIRKYLADEQPGGLWFRQVDMVDGRPLNTMVNVWDAYFPGLLALSGDVTRAARHQDAWDAIWTRYGMIPERFDYASGAVVNGHYTLNPEMMESAYYLWHYTGDPKYRERNLKYYRDLQRCCRVDGGYATIADARTGEKQDIMETFFIAETMKYLWLTFVPKSVLNADDFVFSTEAHPFRRSDFNHAIAKVRLGYR